MVSIFLTDEHRTGRADHSQRHQRTVQDGPDVTKACLQCHEQHAKDFMKTQHWTWSRCRKYRARARSSSARKTRSTTTASRCRQQSALHQLPRRLRLEGRLVRFQQARERRLPGLPRHDRHLQETPAASGNPAYQDTEFPPKSGKIWKAVDLEKIARSVGPTSRATCGACHFYGGGGDHIKHGDLDSSMAAPKRAMDVHMAVDGPNMTCSACHRPTSTRFRASRWPSRSGRRTTLDCTDCHAGTPHGPKAQ